MQMREKVGKSRNTVFFQWFVAPGGRKVGSLKRAGAEPAGQMRDEKLQCRCGAKHISKSKCTKHTSFGPLLEVEMSKKCTPLWREAHFEVKMYKTHQLRTTFGSWDVEKVHAVVARSTFPSQNVQSTTCSRHVWMVGCRKSARHCGAKHISKSTCFKNTRDSDHFWRFRCRFASLGFASLDYTTLHYTTLHYTTLHYTTLHYTPLHYTTFHYTSLHSTTLHSTTLQLHNYTPLHSTTLNYTTLHYTTLHYTTLHYTTFHYTSLHYTTLHYTTTTTTQLHSTTLHYTKLHYATLHYTTLHYTTLHSTTLNYITLHYTTFHYTPLHHTTLHYTTLHSMTLHHR